MVLMLNTLTYIRKLTQSKNAKGRQMASFLASKFFERSGIKQWFGVNLVAAVFMTSIVSPELDNLLHQLTIEDKMKSTPITANIETISTFEQPLSTYRISQLFTFWHSGVDMATGLGNPIYAIDDGTVEFADNSFLGYGKHVIIAHDNNIKSLYGHMSEILATQGQQVSRGEMIGKVGSTGWSTGNHLHLEIYNNGVAINPIDVLPIEKKEIVYDPSFYESKTSSVSDKSVTSAITTTQ